MDRHRRPDKKKSMPVNAMYLNFTGKHSSFPAHVRTPKSIVAVPLMATTPGRSCGHL